MKKFLLILTTICIMFCFSGCHIQTNDEVVASHISEQFVILDRFDDYSGLCYDIDTKIIYMYSASPTYSGWRVMSYTPYYVMDTNNEPVIAVYN